MRFRISDRRTLTYVSPGSSATEKTGATSSDTLVRLLALSLVDERGHDGRCTVVQSTRSDSIPIGPVRFDSVSTLGPAARPVDTRLAVCVYIFKYLYIY